MMTLPFFVPLVLPAAQASAVILRGLPASDAAAWLKVLVGFDLVFVSACVAVFPFTIEE
jgi:heme exporter protein B